MNGSRSLTLTALSSSRNFPRFIKPDSSLPLLQEPAIHSIVGQINPVHVSPFNVLKIRFNIIFPSKPRSSKWSHFIRSLHQNPARNCPLPSTCNMPRPCYSFFIWSSGWYLVSTDYKVSICVFFSTSLPSHSPSTQISSSEPYSQTPSAYVPSSMWETKFHTHTKEQAQCNSVHYDRCVLDNCP